MMNMFDLTGKTAVVTGGTSGIGLMISRGLAQAGARVIVTARKAEAGAQAVAELSQFGEAHFIAADLSKEEAATELASAADEFGGAHILVNNAGAAWGAPLAEFPAAGWDKVLDLNLKAPFFTSRAFVPQLERLGTADDPARIINVGSIDGMRVPDFNNYSYTASKAGVHMLTRVLAKELGPRNITVNAIAPGPFPSKMMAATLATKELEFVASSPLGRIGKSEDMEAAAVYLTSRGASWVTGVILPIDGGIWTTR
jgi:NAD(P)-dependent dehydrogenase (short-subunit alcohol dehydrogenase family)